MKLYNSLKLCSSCNKYKYVTQGLYVFYNTGEERACVELWVGGRTTGTRSVSPGKEVIEMQRHKEERRNFSKTENLLCKQCQKCLAGNASIASLSPLSQSHTQYALAQA